MPKALKLILLSLRDLIVSAGPVVFIVIGALAAAYWYLDPQPPKTVTLATGPDGSAYAEFGQRYASALKANGIEVVLKPTDGAADNLQMLRNGEADLGFVRGGSADPVADEEAGLMSLGSLFYEPLWLFYRSDAARKIDPATGTLTALPQLKTLRINIDKQGSGVPDIVEKMFKANHIEARTLRLSNLEPGPAVAALLAGKLDVVVLASAPQSPLVQRLLRARGIHLIHRRSPLGERQFANHRFAALRTLAQGRGREAALGAGNGLRMAHAAGMPPAPSA